MITSPLGIVVVPLDGRDSALLPLIEGNGITTTVVRSDTVVLTDLKDPLNRVPVGGV